MSTLTITRGYPGSGKTTFARAFVEEAPHERVRINRDDLRFMLWGRYHGLTFEQEQRVTKVQHAAVKAALLAGQSVVVDDTNLRLRNARAWADLAVEVGAEFRCVDSEATVEDCIRWDAERIERGERGVGETVVRHLAQRFVRPWPEVKPTARTPQAPPRPYVPNGSLPTAWLVDIDGTLAHHGDRDIYDLTRVSEDTPDLVILDLVAAVQEQGHDVVFLSGRSEVARNDTEAWLDHHVGTYSPLFMRGADDRRADYLVKAELFDALVRDHYNVVGVLDDRDQVVRMWRAMGLKVLQVADGDF